MGRLGRVPVVLALLATGLAAASALAAFVAPLGTRARPQPQLRRAAAPTGLEALPTADEAAGAGTTEGPSRPWSSAAAWLLGGLVAGVIMAVSTAPAEAIRPAMMTYKPFNWKAENMAHLDLCKNNKKFKKKVKDELFKITKRQDKYSENSNIWNRYKRKVAQVKTRQENYGDRYCGKYDGIPRTIVSPEWNVRGGVTIPFFMFFYITGWIGWSGRSYLNWAHTVPKEPEMKEIVIDIPIFFKCMASGFAWPSLAWTAIADGTMVMPDDEIHVPCGQDRFQY